MNAVAQTLEILLLVEEGVDQLDVLDQIAAFIANNLVHVIEAEVLLYTSPSYFTFTIHAFGQEEGHVLIAGGEFAQGMEHGHLLSDFHAFHAALELAQEALVRQPEQADVGNLEQTHRQPVQSKPYGPATVLLCMIQQEKQRRADSRWHTPGVGLRHNRGAMGYQHYRGMPPSTCHRGTPPPPAMDR